MDNIRKLVIEALADPAYNKEKLDNLKDVIAKAIKKVELADDPCLLYTSPSPRDGLLSRMPSSA